MTLQEIAEVRPRLLDFTAEMLGGLPRKDQRAAGELYVRGLLTGGRRKSMQPMAERLGSIISGCSSSSPHRPGTMPRCGGMSHGGSRPASRWRRW